MNKKSDDCDSNLFLTCNDIKAEKLLFKVEKALDGNSIVVPLGTHLRTLKAMLAMRFLRLLKTEGISS